MNHIKFCAIGMVVCTVLLSGLAHAKSSGDIIFSGTVAAGTCEIVNSEQTIDLGDVRVTEENGRMIFDGQTKKFEIKFRDCVGKRLQMKVVPNESGMATAAQFYIRDADKKKRALLVIKQGVEQHKAGRDLQIYHNKEYNYKISLSEKLEFFASAEPITPEITPINPPPASGKFEAQLNFTFTYS